MDIAKLIKSIKEELNTSSDLDLGLGDSEINKAKSRLGDGEINKAKSISNEDPEIKIAKQREAIAKEKYKLIAQKLADIESDNDKDLFKTSELQDELDSNQKDLIINSMRIMQGRMNQKNRNDLPPDADDALILTALKTAMQFAATRSCPHCGQKPDVKSGMNEFNKTN